MANEQVLTAEQVIEKAKAYLSDEHVAFIKKLTSMRKTHIANNTANRVSRTLSIRSRWRVFWSIWKWTLQR